ncbi:ABC transporter permease [Agrilactobacillus fermenti]|uniref:ABC transporter permease n=1 Tax=Agrilactobacillus fermenti TaxID=2586909 RepID=UPI0022A96D23|nr:ABC transporter permease [Agrilactobacillus fermenti]MCD2255377.1 ABC transporter permease [Agrilactobacillus fermenti]
MICSLLSAEWLKTKRSVFKLMLFSAPILFNLFIFSYLFLSQQKVSINHFCFNYFAVINFLLPFMLSFTLALLSQIEQDANQFNNILGLNRHYYLLLSAKFAFSFLTISGSFLFNISLTIILLKIAFNVPIAFYVSGFSYSFTLIWCAFMTWFVLCFFLSILCRFITMFFFGLATSLLTAIIGLTALGNDIWPFFPFTWGSRLISISYFDLIVLFNEHIFLGFLYLVSPLIIFFILLFSCVSILRK